MPRVGKVRLPRARSAVFVVAVGAALGGAAVPALSASDPPAVIAAAPEACGPPWLVCGGGGGAAIAALPAPAPVRASAEAPAPVAEAPAPVAAGPPPASAPAPTPPSLSSPTRDVIAAAPVGAVERAPLAPLDEIEALPAAPVGAVEVAPLEPVPTPLEAAPVAPVETAPLPAIAAEEETRAAEAERGTRVGGEVYLGPGGGASVTYNDERTRVTVELGWGRDSSVGVVPDAAMPATGPGAEASVTGRVPGSQIGGRATVSVDRNGVSVDAQYNNGVARTGVGAGPDGVDAPESRLGTSVPGVSSGPVGGHASVSYTFDVEHAPQTPPGQLDSDGDGLKDGDMAESPEVGGRQGTNPAGTAPDPTDSDKDGTTDRSDRTIGKDSDEDGVTDDVDQKPGEVDVDADTDGVADQFDGDVSEPSSDGVGAGETGSAGQTGGGEETSGGTSTADSSPGFGEGSFGDSPEMGGRGESDSGLGHDASDAGATDASDDDSGADDAGADDASSDDADDADSSPGFGEGSFGDSPEMGGGYGDTSGDAGV